MGVMCCFLAGCALGRAPQVQVMDDIPIEQSDEAMRVEFLFEFTNPHDSPIELRELTYRVHVDGRSVYTGRRAAQATLPALGTTSLTVPAVIPIERIGEATDYNISGRLIYIRPGVVPQLLRDIGLPRPRVSFAHADRAHWTTAEVINP